MSDGKFFTTTISMTVNFVAPAKPGALIAEAKVTQLGKTIAFVEGKLMRQDGTLVSTASTAERLVEVSRTVG